MRQEGKREEKEGREMKVKKPTGRIVSNLDSGTSREHVRHRCEERWGSVEGGYHIKGEH